MFKTWSFGDFSVHFRFQIIIVLILTNSADCKWQKRRETKEKVFEAKNKVDSLPGEEQRRE